jgi:ketosteroid isomerase-like protein
MKKEISSRYRVIAFSSIVILFLIVASCNHLSKETKSTTTEKDLQLITAMLDSFNIAAANADFNKYFGYYTEDAIFTGTDATERWDKKSFMAFAKPYFDKGKAWTFISLERHIYFDKTGDLAWFDELLNTQMKICRGSGVVVRQGEDWKVSQYILSMTLPNSLIDTILKLKTPEEDEIINKLSKK